MPETQLAFDGSEVSIPASLSHWHPTGVQRMLLALARRPEGVTALQAGIAIHARRKSLGTGGCGFGAKSMGSKTFGKKGMRTKACCLYASSDGSASLMRLADRGLVEQRKPRGPYFAVQND